MATAKQKRSDDALVKEFTNHYLYGMPVSPELQAILDDDDKRQEFIEDHSFDPEILEKYESENH